MSKSLLKKADVTVENMAPHDRAPRLGYDVVKELNPRRLLPVKGFGTGSPYERNLAFDMIAQAAAVRPASPAMATGRRQAGPVIRRHRHRHADGDQHSCCVAQARPHRQRTAAAGGDAGRNGPLYAVPFRHPADGKASATRGSDRSQPGGLVPSALTRASPADRTTMSMSLPAVPIRSIGPGS